jgi:hypothetical protein
MLKNRNRKWKKVRPASDRLSSFPVETTFPVVTFPSLYASLEVLLRRYSSGLNLPISKMSTRFFDAIKSKHFEFIIFYVRVSITFLFFFVVAKKCFCHVNKFYLKSYLNFYHVLTPVVLNLLNSMDP